MAVRTKQLGTFSGVFTPTILTIIGVIMYLRLGWVVGNAGLGGALLIIVLAKIVTITTGLSLSSMSTNVKMGAGGTYALISRSLGAEIGSAIGIPLFLSQAVGGAMYIIGFTEGWLSLFPDHDIHTVSTLVLAGILAVSLVGAKKAMRLQYVIMAVIILSLISFFLGTGEGNGEIVLWGNFESAPFWVVFSVFFPAVTGIAVGASMSGDLRDPRKSMPAGILSAIGISMFIYIGAAVWLDSTSTTEQLLHNYTIMVDVSRWKMLVLAGILGATLSSALSSVVGAPRTLMALGQDKVLPFSRLFAWRSKNNEPLISLVVTVILIETSLLTGDLNSIAPLLTMFFLITYGAVNLAVLIEQGIGIPSFRPRLKIPMIIPLIGSVWCFIIMFIINALFAGVSLIVILGVYLLQVRRGITAPWGDVRVGLFSAIAEWAAQVSSHLPHHAKTWKPNLLVPVENPREWTSLIRFIGDIVFPSGTLRVFTAHIIEKDSWELDPKEAGHHARSKKPRRLPGSAGINKLEKQLQDLISPVKENGIFTAAIAIECHNFLEGVDIISRVMKDMIFPPNIVFLTLSREPGKDDVIEKIIAISERDGLGVIILALQSKTVFSGQKRINVWLRTGSPNIDLSLLIALQLERNWNSGIRLLTVVGGEQDKRKAENFLRRIVSVVRMPADTEVSVIVGDFNAAVEESPAAGLNVFGMRKDANIEIMRETLRHTEISCLFVKDSGQESATA